MRSASFRFLLTLATLVGGLPSMLASAVTAHAGVSPTSDSIHATGTTIPVSNCKNSGSGSLRDAVAMAHSGDTIDMTGLACGRIVLTTGAIAIPQDHLSLVGKGPNLLAVDGNRSSQVFVHTGMGTLRLRRLSATHGRVAGPNAFGGCIYGAANVELREVKVRNCAAQASSTTPSDNTAAGGGVYAAGNLKLFNSLLDANSAVFSGSGGNAFGGGAFAGGRLTIGRSRICNNHSGGDGGGAFAHSLDARHGYIHANEADRDSGGIAVGGGFEPYPDSTLANSTIAGNHAHRHYGGADLSRGIILVVNSTISDNVADNEIGGLHISSGWESRGPSTIANSTIAFNRQSTTSSECGALYWLGDRLNLESTIVAKNLCRGQPGGDIDVDFRLEPVINLIGSSSVAVPPGTISADPVLLALANNGGPTRTHALGANSPAIDAGNNSAGLGYDQRGKGYPRTKGARTDIGAYER